MMPRDGPSPAPAPAPPPHPTQSSAPKPSTTEDDDMALARRLQEEMLEADRRAERQAELDDMELARRMQCQEDVFRIGVGGGHSGGGGMGNGATGPRPGGGGGQGSAVGAAPFDSGGGVGVRQTSSGGHSDRGGGGRESNRQAPQRSSVSSTPGDADAALARRLQDDHNRLAAMFGADAAGTGASGGGGTNINASAGASRGGGGAGMVGQPESGSSSDQMAVRDDDMELARRMQNLEHMGMGQLNSGLNLGNLESPPSPNSTHNGPGQGTMNSTHNRGGGQHTQHQHQRHPSDYQHQSQGQAQSRGMSRQQGQIQVQGGGRGPTSPAPIPASPHVGSSGTGGPVTPQVQGQGAPNAMNTSHHLQDPMPSELQRNGRRGSDSRSAHPEAKFQVPSAGDVAPVPKKKKRGIFSGFGRSGNKPAVDKGETAATPQVPSQAPPQSQPSPSTPRPSQPPPLTRTGGSGGGPPVVPTAIPPPPTHRLPGPLPHSVSISSPVPVAQPTHAQTVQKQKKKGAILPSRRAQPPAAVPKCDVCHQTAMSYLATLNKKFHPKCFRCMGCHEVIDPTSPFAFMTDERGEKNPLHRQCYAELYGVKCAVCMESIPAGTDGKVSYVKHPFFETEQMCPRHASNPGRRCTGCHRFEPNGTGFADLGDANRCVCYSCCRTVVVDSEDAKPLWEKVIRFFEDKLKLPIWPDMRDVPVLVVGFDALNDQLKNSAHSGSSQIMTRGLCLSEHMSGRKITLQRLRFDRANRSFCPNDVESKGYTFFQVPDANKINPDSSVTAILCLSGLPADLTASVLAHEATHAWFKLHPSFNITEPIPLQVEEGCCQLLALLFLNDGLGPASSASGDDNGPSDEKLRQYFKFSIETDENEIYGAGYRMAAKAYANIGIEALLSHVVLYKEFPEV